jgi:hypothetical protein
LTLGTLTPLEGVGVPTLQLEPSDP